MKKTMVFFFLILFSFSCGEKENNTIKIGAILPITGGAASYGKMLQEGIDLATDEVNNNGGVLGRQIQIIYEDDAGQATTGVSAINKLINVREVDCIIGGAMSSVAMALAPISREKKVVLLSPTATDPALSDAGKYFFRIWPSDNYDGKVMATVARDTLKLDRIATLYINVAYGQGINNVFVNEFEELGGEIVAQESYVQGATDFRSQLTKIKELQPQALFLPGYYQEMSQILKQVKELGLKTRILSVNSFYDPRLLEIAGNTAEGAVFTYPTYDVNNNEEVTKNFVDSFEKKYSETPDAFAAQGYDALKVLVEGINLGKGQNSDAIIKGLLKVEYKGPGGKIKFEPNGDVEKQLRLMTVKNNNFINIQKLR